MDLSVFEKGGFTVQIDKVESEFMATLHRQGVFYAGQDGFTSYDTALQWATTEIESLGIQVLHS